MKLLLIEDEEDMSQMLAKGLRKLGYAVDCAFDGEEGVYLFSINEYDLIILDLNLPKIDGLDVLREIRKTSTVKVIILSARVEVDQRVEGLNLGADDYLCKPFAFKELDARITTVLRREMNKPLNEIVCGKITINLLNKNVFINEKQLSLTKKEYSIIEYLARNLNTLISAEQLIEHIWDSDVNLFSNSLKFHIHSLKKKLGDCRNHIKNIRGQGYILTEEK